MAIANPITVIILAHNEADNLQELLPQLSWADAVMVVDDESTDTTAEVAKAFGALVVSHPVKGDFSQARNQAKALVREGWVLFLDADERLPSTAPQNIREAVATASATTVFALQRIDAFLGKMLKYGETGDTWLVRLGPANVGAFVGKVHEVWQGGTVTKLSVPIIHASHPSVTQLFAVVNDYARLRARELFDQGKYWNAWEQFWYPVVKFGYTFVLKRGFLDGWPGFLMSLSMSYHSFLVRFYLWTQLWVHTPKMLVVWKYVVLLPFLLLPLGQLQRWQLTSTMAVTLHEVGMVVAVILGLGIIPWKRVYMGRYFPWLLFTGLLLLSWLGGLIQGYSWTGGLYLARWILYVGYLIVLVESIRDRLVKISITGLLLFVGSLLLLSGVLQYILMPDARWLYLLGWDDHYYRMIGTLLDPNYLGLMLVLTSLLVWSQFQGMQKVAGLLLLAVGLIATYSRASWVVGIVSMGILLVTSKLSWRQLGGVVGGLLFMVGVFFALPKVGGVGTDVTRVFSIHTRVNSMQEAWQVFSRYPVMGVGFNNYRQIQPASSQYGQPYHASAPDNSLLYVLATAGVIGFGGFAFLLGSLAYSFKQPWMRVSLLAIVLHSMVNNSFFYPWVLLWLIGLVAVTWNSEQ